MWLEDVSLRFTSSSGVFLSQPLGPAWLQQTARSVKAQASGSQKRKGNHRAMSRAEEKRRTRSWERQHNRYGTAL